MPLSTLAAKFLTKKVLAAVLLTSAPVAHYQYSINKCTKTRVIEFCSVEYNENIASHPWGVSPELEESYAKLRDASIAYAGQNWYGKKCEDECRKEYVERLKNCLKNSLEHFNQQDT